MFGLHQFNTQFNKLNMTNKNDNTKNIKLRNESTKPNGGAPISVDKQHVAKGVDGIIPPKSDEYAAFAIPEIINASHLFVVAGQECICLTDTIAGKAKKRLKPR